MYPNLSTFTPTVILSALHTEVAEGPPEPAVRIPTLYEDKYLHICDKPPGKLVHPSSNSRADTVRVRVRVRVMDHSQV